jgi:hypothetical protein
MLPENYSGVKTHGVDLQEILTQEHRDMGYYLEEEEHFIYLYDRNGERLAVFSAQGATFFSIREEVQKLMNNRSN